MSTSPAIAVAPRCGPALVRTGRRAPSMPSWPQDHALASNQRARPRLLGGGGDLVHDRIIVAGIVMEDDQRLGGRGIGETDAFLPCRMTPGHEARKFLIRVGR